ncbi:MAG TPA: AcvB/VirJ family lysyl-phosphatidylglycerol hydrolase [Chitinophagaceae bacterium]
MKKIICFIGLAILSACKLNSQSCNLPVKEWKKNDDTPLVVYLSGDGGFNKFSIELCNSINTYGYSVTAIDSRSYFWNKKTPEQTAADITSYLIRQFNVRKNQQLILSGYSFGADVMPFIVNRLPDAIRKKLEAVIILSPSTSTDFEIHWSDIFGGTKKRNMDVVAEINKMKVSKAVIFFGDDEDKFPLTSIRTSNLKTERFAGGHHYDGNTGEVAKAMIKHF